jgi:predicted AlkP superfamily pyrophosphatase or phosphodiesterase
MNLARLPIQQPFFFLTFGLIVSLSLLSFSNAYADVSFSEKKRPKLVLQVTVDQLRGDLPARYFDRLGKGGFRFLLEDGLVYSNAHHAHANTETIVGHATLATGAQPAVHGMVGNLWLDRSTGDSTYNIEDPNYELLSKGAGVDGKSEIDPTQKAAKSQGRSPAAIMVTTLGDELSVNTNGKAKVFGVSVKDRGAVAMAGHSGKAFWFSKSNGEFVTSNYYYDEYPNWVNDWNSKGVPASYANTDWSLLNPSEGYMFADSDDREWETDLAGFGRVFPHSYGAADGKYFTTLLTTSPAGDEITLDFAKTLMVAEKIGQDDVTDYLSVSFSSTDYVGHLFGPSSLEAEDNLLRLDKTLANLFAAVDEYVGLDNTLIVLSADHGAPEAPGYLSSQGISAGYVDPSSWPKDEAINRLKKKFKIKGELIEKYVHPYVYLAPSVVNKDNTERQEIEAAVVQELMAMPGVYLAVSSAALQKGNIPDNPIYKSVSNNFYAKRSGDIYIVFEPNWYLNDFDGLMVASTHGSPWTYDSYVPVIFAGHGVDDGRVDRKIHTVDIASSIAAYLNIKAPSGAFGDVLSELLE